MEFCQKHVQLHPNVNLPTVMEVQFVIVESQQPMEVLIVQEIQEIMLIKLDSLLGIP